MQALTGLGWRNLARRHPSCFLLGSTIVIVLLYALSLNVPLLLCLCTFPAPARSQNTATAVPASVKGFNCTANRTYPCQAYALYRAGFRGRAARSRGHR
jgi:hypothetical protein